MRDEYDFSDAIKNPFAGRTKGKYTVIVHYDFTDSDDAKTDGGEPDGGVSTKPPQTAEGSV